MKFADKVVIVTGGGRGIGEDYARALAGAGAAVTVADIDEENAARVAEEIKAAGGSAIHLRCDVTSESDAAASAAATIEAFGGIDYLINNAAIYGGMRRETLLSVALDYYRRFMDVNMNGALVMSRAVVEAMESRGGGAIINQSSASAYLPGNYYGLAKLALNGLTTCLAGELGPKNIRINGIAPGPVPTEATNSSVPATVIENIVKQLPLGRMGTTQDMVDACFFLLSNEASWITGQTLCVDGGMIRRPA